ncbi:MAG: T3SS effector HopA1 family protein [Pseudomonadota bacterium]
MADLNSQMKKWRRTGYLDRHMKPSLKIFLERCWTEQQKRPGADLEGLIYNLYSNTVHRKKSNVSPLVGSILRTFHEMGRPVRIQPVGDATDIGDAKTHLIRLGGADGGSVIEMSTFALGQLVTAVETDAEVSRSMEENFVHVRTGRGSGRKRLYLSVKGARRKYVARWINANFTRWGVLDNWKMAVPSSNWSRADTFVLYFTNKFGVDNAIKDLEAYQSKAAAKMHFRDEMPHMLKKVDGLTGVAYGDEPVCGLKLHFDKRSRTVLAPDSTVSVSFGSYRAKLIAAAMRLTLRENQGLQDYLCRVGCFFEKAGINPMQPELNVDPGKLRKTAEDVVQQDGGRNWKLKPSKNFIQVRRAGEAA